MKLILLSDMHLMERTPQCRTDNFESSQFDKLEFILKYAQQHQYPILQAGDFFDRPRGYKVLFQVIQLLNKYSNVDIYCIAGQHDMYLRTDQTTNINILDHSNFISKLGTVPHTINKNITLYGCNWNDPIPKILKNRSSTHILIIHAPITIPKDETYLDYIDYDKANAFIKKHKGFDLILCGDIHKKFTYKKNDRIICNTGPLLRTTADKHIISHKPIFFVYDTIKKTIKTVAIPHKDAMDIITTEHIERKNEIAEILDDFVGKLKEEKTDSMNIIKAIQNIIKKDNIESDVKNILADLIEEK